MSVNNLVKKETNYGGGMGFIGGLQLLFIGLKLAGVGVVATWSWPVVMLPFIILWSLIIVLFLGVLVLGLIAS